MLSLHARLLLLYTTQLGMLAVHSTATNGFTQQAEAYAKLRPTYPTEALEQIKSLVPDRNAQITDLAAGTGKMTKLLLEHGYLNVTAIEPVDAMRDTLVTLLPVVQAIKGSSWDIPVASQSQDAIIVAQAFHWFADIECLEEIHRVLKPNGYLILIWNKENINQGQWVEQIYKLCSQHAPHHHRAWREVFETNKAQTLFKVPLTYRKFPHDIMYTKQDLWALTQTRSYIATLPEDEKQIHERKVKEIIADPVSGPTMDANGLIRFPYVSNFFWTQKI